jgi:hypothetical protein
MSKPGKFKEIPPAKELTRINPINLHQNSKVAVYLYIVLIIGTILVIMGNLMLKNSNSNSAIETIVSGYVFVLIGIIVLMPLAIYFHKINIRSYSSFFEKFVLIPFPSIITIIVIIFIMLQTLSYKEQLLTHDIANEYYTYSSIFSLMLIAQISLLIYYSANITSSSQNISSYRYAIYLFGFFNLILIGMMNIVLKYFSTDG